MATNSEEGYALASFIMHLNIFKIFLILLITGLTYHFISGIRHLVMDFGYWDTLKAGKISAITIIVLSILVSFIFAVIIW